MFGVLRYRTVTVSIGTASFFSMCSGMITHRSLTPSYYGPNFEPMLSKLYFLVSVRTPQLRGELSCNPNAPTGLTTDNSGAAPRVF
jgi:hypothetical protein